MRYIIDRFEDPFAVCEAEDKTMVNILISELPLGCLPGCFIESTKKGYILLDNYDDRDRIKNKMKALYKSEQ